MKILLIKTSSLGDVVHTFGVLRYLRKRFPDAQIDWVVEKSCKELVEAHPDLSRAIVIDTKLWRQQLLSPLTWHLVGESLKKLRASTYDSAFDLQGNCKSGLLLGCIKAKKKVGFGFKSVAEWPNVLFTRKRFNPPLHQNIREDYLFVVQAFFQDNAPFEEEPVLLKLSCEEEKKAEAFRSESFQVLVAPGSAWPNKQLSQKTLLSLLQTLSEKRKAQLFFSWGSEKERVYATELASYFPQNGYVLEKCSLPLLQNVMARMNLVIAMDSLPLHLCGTTQTPSLSAFGPSSLLKYQPKGEQHVGVQGVCPYKVSFEKRCPKLRTCPTGFCIKSLPASLLVQAYEDNEKEKC